MIPAIDTQKNNDGQLWSIIEKQRLIIVELQKALSEVTTERDHLLLANTTTPIPPPRSPYRSHHKKKQPTTTHVQDEQDMFAIALKVKSIHADSFTLSVIDKKKNQELWRIEKLYTDLLCLDMAVNINLAPIAILSLKNNKLDFLFSNTNSMDKTLLLIDEYLEDTIQLLKHDLSILYSFFIEKKLKQGYLTKRNVACCKKYYFVLSGPELRYLVKKDDEGLSMGVITLVPDTRIGKQQQPTKKHGDALFQHAFIVLLEQENHAYKYILCAGSDAERDEWVKQLHRQQCSTVPHHNRPNSDISMHLEKKKNNIRHKQYKRSSMDDKAIQKVNDSNLFNQLSTKASDDSIPTTIDSEKKVSRRTFWARNRKLLTNTEDDYIDPSSSSSSTINAPNYQVFGVSLEETIRLTRISEKFDLPAIVYRCIAYLEAKDAIHEEGIYRQNGSSVQINHLRHQFCEYGDVDLLAMTQTGYHLDVNVVAGLLKMWLRELPVNILTFDLLNDFLKVIDEKNKQARIKKLGHLVSMLPIANYSLLRTLIAHLIHIVHNSEHNKMTLRNIGIVFAPTLSIPSGIFTLFMSEFEYIFWTNKTTAVSSLPTFKKPVYPIVVEASTSADRIKQQYLKAEEVRSSRNSVLYKNNVPLSIMSLETVINKVKYNHMDLLADCEDLDQ